MGDTMNVKIISCQIFEVYINELLKTFSPQYQYDIEYFEINQHNHPKEFNLILQNRINEIKDYDLIVLVYGICGNSTSYLKAGNTPIVIPRVHDCSTILLGNKDRYKEVFGSRPSQGWSCLSYRFEDSHNSSISTQSSFYDLVKKYGEDNAMYLYNTLYPIDDSKVYISLGLNEDIERIKELDSKTEVVKGSFEYLSNILKLDYKDLLVLNSNEEIVPIYDFDVVISKK